MPRLYIFIADVYACYFTDFLYFVGAGALGGGRAPAAPPHSENAPLNAAQKCGKSA